MTYDRKRNTGGEVELLPLPEADTATDKHERGHGDEAYTNEQMRAYADRAERALAESRAEVDRLNELCNGLHRRLTESQAGFVHHRTRAERLAEALREIAEENWTGVRPIQIKARAALEQEPQE